MKNIVVFGGTGQQGSAFVRALAHYNSPEIQYGIYVLTRGEGSGAKLATLPGVKLVVSKDYMNHPGRAFEDTGLKTGEVHGAFGVTGYDDKGDKEVAMGNAMASAAHAYGVEHYIFAAAAFDQKMATSDDGLDTKRRVETHIKSLGMPYTMLHPTDFMDNWLPTQTSTLRIYRTWLLRRTFITHPDRKLQMVSTRDIGRAGALAIHRPDMYLNSTMELVGDELDIKQIVQTYQDVMGEKPTECWGITSALGWWFSPDIVKMLRMYDQTGTTADPLALQKALGEKEGFRAFLERFKRDGHV